MEATIVKTELGGRDLILETGRLAKQAGGAVLVTYGESVVLVTACVKPEAAAINPGFFPLSVEYVEKSYAAGKIPGGFFKREGRPNENATLTSRFIDRPIRPLFPKDFYNETQVIATVLSHDGQNGTDVMAMIGASAALTISEAPFEGPIAGVRIARVDGEFVINPLPEQSDNADLDLIVAGSKDAVVMVEGGADNVSEADMVKAIMAAHKAIQPLLEMQLTLQKKLGKAKLTVATVQQDSELIAKVKKLVGERLEKAVKIPVKQERYQALSDVKDAVVKEIVGESDDAALKTSVKNIYSDLKKDFVRQMIVNTHKRIDGRGLTDVRPISIETGVLPRTHGSAIFTRGETQVISVVTLGTKDDQQFIDTIEGDYYKRFMLHYNFAPFSVGEVKRIGSPGRREVGHGALAERAVKVMLPDEDNFTYTIRAVAETLESNGSSSMATVCATSLALMDAGVPMKAAVAGVAMGLIHEGDKTAVLTDILGDEDHLGDMDFKVTGTAQGVTALQMDIKIKGITEALLTQALSQAREARMHILGEMSKVKSAPNADLSQYAPRITKIQIAQDMIGALIGPGGKNIRAICEATGVKIDIEDDGSVLIASTSKEASDQALKLVKASTSSAEINKYYMGKVARIVDFGAFVEIMPGVDGLVHISELEPKRVEKVTDVLKEGEAVLVKVIEVDAKSGKVRLSRKQAIGYTGEIEGGV